MKERTKINHQMANKNIFVSDLESNSDLTVYLKIF